MNKGYPPLPDTKIVIKMKIFPKICALVAVSLGLPVLAYTNKGGNNKGDTPERHEDNKNKDKDKDKDEDNKGREDNKCPGPHDDKKVNHDKDDHPGQHDDKRNDC